MLWQVSDILQIRKESDMRSKGHAGRLSIGDMRHLTVPEGASEKPAKVLACLILKVSCFIGDSLVDFVGIELV